MIVFSCFWMLGTILETSLAWAVMPKLGWRWLLALSPVPSFVLLIFYGIAPESPRYLCMKGRTDDAMRLLEKMARINQKPLPSGTLGTDYKVALDENINPSENTHRVMVQSNDSTIDEEAGSKTGGIKNLYWLLSPALIKTTLLLSMDFFGNAFAYYGIVLLTTELINEKRCRSRGSSSSPLAVANPYKDVFITSFAELPGLLFAAVIVDRVGRKLSMLAMLLLAGVFLFPLMFHQKEVVIIVLLFGARACVTGSINTLYIYAPEVYPTSMRSSGLGIASSVGRIGGIVCPLVAVGLVEGCHQMGAVLVFEAVIFLSGLAVAFFPFETKGRGLSDTLQASE